MAHRGLNAIMEPLVEPLPHINALLDETRGACWFTKFDLAKRYNSGADAGGRWWNTCFRSQLGHFECKVLPFGLQGLFSVLMRVMNAAMTRGLRWTASDPAPTPPAARTGVFGATVLSTGPSCLYV